MKILCCFLLFLLSSCTNNSCSPKQETLRSWLINNGKIKVLCTTGMITDVVKKIGGDHTDVITLIEGDLDPHSYQLVKGDDEKLEFSQIIFSNGLGLEHGPSLQYYLENSAKSVFLGPALGEKYQEKILHIRGYADPHIWMDVSMWSETIPIIVANLSKQDPQHAHEYENEGKKIYEELQNLHQEIIKILKDIPDKKRYLVTSHDAFNYFARAYLVDNSNKQDSWEKRFHAPEGLSPESQLSTLDIQRTLEFILQHDIHTLFPESNVSKDSIRKVVEAGNERGLDLKMAKEPLYGDSMGCSKDHAGTYQTMMLHNAKTIANFLK